jgi:hypothetical protein
LEADEVAKALKFDAGQHKQFHDLLLSLPLPDDTVARTRILLQAGVVVWRNGEVELDEAGDLLQDTATELTLNDAGLDPATRERLLRNVLNVAIDAPRMRSIIDAEFFSSRSSKKKRPAGPSDHDDWQKHTGSRQALGADFLSPKLRRDLVSFRRLHNRSSDAVGVIKRLLSRHVINAESDRPIYSWSYFAAAVEGDSLAADHGLENRRPGDLPAQMLRGARRINDPPQED